MTDFGLNIAQWMDPAKCVPSTWFRWLIVTFAFVVYCYYLYYADLAKQKHLSNLMMVFILCGFTHLAMGVSMLWQYAKAICIISYPFLIYYMHRLVVSEKNSIKTLKTTAEVDEIIENERSFITKELIDQVFEGDEVKEWFYNEGLHGAADDKGYFIMLSDQWEKVLGWTKEEMMSKPFIEFVHPEDQEDTKRVYNNGKNLDYGEYYYNRYLTKSGKSVRLKWPKATKRIGKSFAFKAELDNGKQ